MIHRERLARLALFMLLLLSPISALGDENAVEKTCSQAAWDASKWSTPTYLPAYAGLILIRGGHSCGMGVLIDSDTHLAVTVSHVAADLGVSISWTDGGKRSGSAKILGDDPSSGISYLILDEASEGMSAARVSNSLPAAGSRMWSVLLLMGGSVGPVDGTYVGLDADHDMVLDIAVYPGSSGSGAYDSNGRVFALINASGGNAHPAFRALGFARPLNQSHIEAGLQLLKGNKA